MNLTYDRTVLLIAVMLLSSSLLAQLGSSQPYNAPIQPNQQTNGGASGAGMAGTMNGTTGAIDPMGQRMKDKLFLHNAIEGGLAEMRMGELAARNGSSDEVKRLGQKMADDYSSLNSGLERVADSIDAVVPTKMSKKDRLEHDKLRPMSGDNFDQEYLAYIIRNQTRDLRDFQTKEASTPESELKTAVEKALLLLQQHAQMMETLHKQKTAPATEHDTGPAASKIRQSR